MKTLKRLKMGQKPQFFSSLLIQESFPTPTITPHPTPSSYTPFEARKQTPKDTKNKQNSIY
jgi:hypothetical protein